MPDSVCVCVLVQQSGNCACMCVMAPLINVVIAPKCNQLQQQLPKSVGVNSQTPAQAQSHTYVYYIDVQISLAVPGTHVN